MIPTETRAPILAFWSKDGHMEEALCDTMMVVTMKVTGIMDVGTELEEQFLPTMTSLKEVMTWTSGMVMVCTNGTTVVYTLVSFSRINDKVVVHTHGLMELFTKESSRLATDMDKECTASRMDPFTQGKFRYQTRIFDILALLNFSFVYFSLPLCYH